MIKAQKPFFIFIGIILCSACIFIMYIYIEQLRPENKTQDFILKKADKKLISEIGKEAHKFYKHRFFKDRNSSRLEYLLDEAEKRGFSASENVKWAKRVLAQKKDFCNKHLNKSIPNDKMYSVDFIGLAKRRQSIRFFLDKKISDEDIKQILESAIEAPSSCNRQTWRFLVIDDKESKDFIATWRGEKFIRNAPVIILVFVDSTQYSLPAEEQTQWMDGSTAIMSIIYAAESLGLSSCWVNCAHGQQKKKELIKYFKLDENLLPVSLVVLGYSDQRLDKPAREKLQYYLLNKKE